MAKVEVVNRQVIDGKEYKRGQVIEVAPGRARDLVRAGKARVPVEKPKPAESAKPAEKGGK